MRYLFTFYIALHLVGYVCKAQDISAESLSGIIAQDANNGSSANQYLAYASGLAEVLSTLSDDQIDRVFKEVPVAALLSGDGSDSLSETSLDASDFTVPDLPPPPPMKMGPTPTMQSSVANVADHVANISKGQQILEDL
ncbi:MAG: hypothetical protein AAF226_16770, partial [Verrucomicrobiota bacterium]